MRKIRFSVWHWFKPCQIFYKNFLVLVIALIVSYIAQMASYIAQKSSSANINSLVQNGELIINSERSAWMSSPGSGDSKKSDPKDDGEGGGDIEETPIQIGSEEKKEA